jgi:hypothetical protein
MSRGRDISARPMASICCSPPDSVPARCRWRSASTGKSAYTRSRISAKWARAAGRKAPILRVSATLRAGKIRRPSGTWAMPRATISCAGRPVSGLPSKSIAPARTGTRPEMTRISVVLPAPLGPTTATASPASTRRLTLQSAVNSP